MYMTEVLGAKCISWNMLDMKNETCEPYSAPPQLRNCWVQNVWQLRNCWLQNVYGGSVGCKKYIKEQAGHEK
jgi:hypothetical protein